MQLSEEIMAALQAAEEKGSSSLLDQQTGRSLQVSLQRTLGGYVEDRTAYLSDRAYGFEVSVVAPAGRTWRTALRVRVSGVGPYASHVFVQSYNTGQWWAGALRTDRQGFCPEDAAALQKLHTWLLERGLRELDWETQGVMLPRKAGPESEASDPISLSQLLFGSGLAR